MLGLGQVEREADRAADDLVGRRLVDAAGVVVARPDPGDVAGRRHELRLAGERVEDLDPRPVERRVLAVVAGLVDPPLLDLLGVEPWRRVEDGDAVAHQLAVGDHRELDGLEALQVDHALLVHGHQVGDGQHRDLVDGLEAGEAGAVGGVADVVVGRHARRDRGGAAGEGGRSGGGSERARLLDRDRLRLRLDDRRDVLLALRGRQVVERLDLPAAALDDELERALVGRRLRRRRVMSLPSGPASRAATWNAGLALSASWRPRRWRWARRRRRRRARRTRRRRRSGSSRRRRGRGTSPR